MYRERVTVQRPDDSPERDAHGQRTSAAGNWIEHHRPYCSIAARGSREFERLGIVNGDVTHVLRCRQSSETLAITPQMRIVLPSGDVLDITAAYRVNQANLEVQIEAKKAA